MNIPNHPETDRLQLTKVLHALSDPLRLELVKQLAETTEKRAEPALMSGSLNQRCPITSKCCGKRGSPVRIDGKHRYYSLRKDDLQAAFPMLEAILQTEPDRW